MRIYPRIRKLQKMNGDWQLILEKSKQQSPRILFEHPDKSEVTKYERLYREGRIR